MTQARLAIVLAWLVPVLPATALAQTPPTGPEFQINTTTAYSEGLYGIDVAADAAGNFVVVWDGYGDGLDVFAQRFDSGGNSVGGEFVVNTTTYSAQAYLGLAVASDPAGNFLVVWNSFDASLQSDVLAQRYDSAGIPQGGEFVVNTYTTGDQGTYTGVDVAADSSGNFVVVWSDGTYYGGQDGSPGSIFGQRFAGNGSPIGGEFPVNTYTTGGQDRPVVAADSTGNFVVAWMGRGPGDDSGIFGQRFDSSGAPVGAEFLVNTYTTGSQGSYGGLDVAMAPSGSFVVAWGGPGAGDYSGAFARRYDSAGVPQGAQFMVNTYTTGYQENGGIAAAARADGSFVVVWSHEYQDGDQLGVFGQEYDVGGAPVGANFQVNSYTTGSQGTGYLRSRPVAVVPTGGESFVVTWNSYEGQDGSESGVFGQRFGDAGPPPPLGCSPVPQLNCRQSTAVRKGTLLLKDRTPDRKDSLTWKWQRGSATALADYGDPTTEGGTDYVLCVYDDSANTQPRLQARAPAGGQCPGRPCWRQFGDKRFEYKNSDLDPDGLRLVRLQRGDEGKARITVRGKRENLDMPTLPLTVPVVAQLQAKSGECWENVYSDFILRNVSTQFKAKPNAPTTTTTTTTSTTVMPTTTTTTIPGVCGDNQVNQGAEECDGTDDGACTGVCSPTCLCTCGLTFAVAPEVSPDGAHVYVAAGLVSGGSLATFSRNATTGELQFVEAYFDDLAGVDGLRGAVSVTLSPDGAHVYVAGQTDDAVAVFSRDGGTGALTFVEAEFDGVDGVDGLEDSSRVAVSPDGAHVYAVGLTDDAVAVFSRDGGTGALTFVEALFDNTAGIDGLDAPRAITVSPDGSHVYVAGAADDAVAVFSRDGGTGALTFGEAEFDGVGGVDGIDGAVAVTVSADGAHVYVAGSADNAVALFSRDTGTGELTFDGMTAVVDAPLDVRMSPDGAHVYVTGFAGSLGVFSRNAVTGVLTPVETEVTGGTAFLASVSSDGAHVYVTDLFGGSVSTLSRDGGTGEVTLLETIVDGPDCAASPSGAFVELPGDLFD